MLDAFFLRSERRLDRAAPRGVAAFRSVAARLGIIENPL